MINHRPEVDKNRNSEVKDHLPKSKSEWWEFYPKVLAVMSQDKGKESDAELESHRILGGEQGRTKYEAKSQDRLATSEVWDQCKEYSLLT